MDPKGTGWLQPGKLWYEALTFVLGAILGAITSELIAKRILISQWLTLCLVGLCLIMITLMLRLLIGRVNELLKRVGVKIRYLSLEEHGRQEIFREFRKLVAGAREEILALTTLTPRHGAAESDSAAATERAGYYDDLIASAIQRGVVYERVVQLEEPNDLRTVPDHFLQHFRRMLEAKAAKPAARIGLQKSAPRTLTTFVLIDSAHLIWEIDEFVAADEVRMRGCFVIDDPRGEITRPLREIYERLRQDSLGAIRADELPAAGAAAERGSAAAG